METIGFILGTASPLLFWGLRALTLRRLPAGQRLLLDLALFLGSIPFAMSIIARALHFPPDAGDHPGVGVMFLPFALVWIICMLIWLARLIEYAIRKFRAAA